MTLSDSPRRSPAWPPRSRPRSPAWKSPAWITIPAASATGWLFFAFPGSRADGRAFARRRPRAAAPSPWSANRPPPEDFAGALDPGGARPPALALAARNFYRRPDERLRLTGITGTNGKTTTALPGGFHPARGRPDHGHDRHHRVPPGRARSCPPSTPRRNRWTCYRIFAELEQAGGTHATMEVSSHALALGRVYGLHFHTAVFTNLTRDHLDFHGTMEEYFAAKQLLFDGAARRLRRSPSLNRDDDMAARRIAPADARSTGTAWGRTPTCAPATSRPASTGCVSRCSTRKLRFRCDSPLIGKINVYNILAACCGGPQLRPRRRSDRARHRRAAARCPAASSGWTKASRSSSWWTTPTPTTRCATSSRWRAASAPSA